MAFTYSLSHGNDDIVLVSKVRLELGDTVENQGVKPNNENLTDAEILLWLGEEDDSVMHACIRACDSLSRWWARVPDLSIAGRSENLSDISAMWAKTRDDLIATYGRAAGMSTGTFSHTPTRNDGYTENYSPASEYTYLDDEGYV